MSKKQLYESIMKNVSLEVKKALNEACITPEQKSITYDVITAIADELSFMDTEDAKIEYTNNLTDEDSNEFYDIVNVLCGEKYGYNYIDDLEGCVGEMIYDVALAMQRFDFDEDKCYEYFENI